MCGKAAVAGSRHAWVGLLGCIRMQTEPTSSDAGMGVKGAKQRQWLSIYSGPSHDPLRCSS